VSEEPVWEQGEAVDARRWHMRLQPAPQLDEDEQDRVMRRLQQAIEPFLESGLVVQDVARDVGSHFLLQMGLERPGPKP
jgi:hypothetical protein